MIKLEERDDLTRSRIHKNSQEIEDLLQGSKI